MYKRISQIGLYWMNLNVVVLIITGYSFLGFNLNSQNVDFGDFLYHLWGTFSDNHTVNLTVDCRQPNWRWRRLFFISSTRRTKKMWVYFDKGLLWDDGLSHFHSKINWTFYFYFLHEAFTYSGCVLFQNKMLCYLHADVLELACTHF